ncbi:MAG: carbamoyl phosphate synthase small subunit [Heyndrickxia sp.]
MFPGKLCGHATEDIIGEVVFNTSMTGYQEIMTDPSYAGQIIVFCYPLIGNYGMNPFDDESNDYYAKGIVTNEISEVPNHYKSDCTVMEILEKKGKPFLTGVDTRALVKTIRKRGTVKGMISKNNKIIFPKISEPFYIGEVSTKSVITYENNGPHIVLMDFGCKKSILNYLLERKCKVSVVPYHFTFKQIEKWNPDGVVLSNGPGNPMAMNKWLPEIKKISAAYPTLGICLGHQLIALAYGSQTIKLPYGHRGANHPVKDLKTGKVMMTSQNHGYVVKNDTINRNLFHITYRHVNDGTVEGLRHVTLPIHTVQFHPEAHPGPQDTEYIFDQFIQILNGTTGVLSYAIQ